MGLFSKQRKEQIPEVQQPTYGQAQANSNRPGAASISSAAPSYRSNAPSYVPPSLGGGGYGARVQQPGPQQPQYGQQDRQPSYGSQASSQSRGPVSRGPSYNGAGPGARDELLRGAPPPRAPQGQGQYGASNGGDEYQSQSQSQEDPEEEEVEGIKQQMRCAVSLVRIIGVARLTTPPQVRQAGESRLDPQRCPHRPRSRRDGPRDTRQARRPVG